MTSVAWSHIKDLPLSKRPRNANGRFKEAPVQIRHEGVRSDDERVMTVTTAQKVSTAALEIISALDDSRERARLRGCTTSLCIRIQRKFFSVARILCNRTSELEDRGLMAGTLTKLSEFVNAAAFGVFNKTGANSSHLCHLAQWKDIPYKGLCSHLPLTEGLNIETMFARDAYAVSDATKHALSEKRAEQNRRDNMRGEQWLGTPSGQAYEEKYDILAIAGCVPDISPEAKQGVMRTNALLWSAWLAGKVKQPEQRQPATLSDKGPERRAPVKNVFMIL